APVTVEIAPLAHPHRRHVELVGDDPEVRPEREPDLLGRGQLIRDRVERTVEGDGTLAQCLVEQVLLRVDVGVDRALLYTHRLGQVADRGAVVPLLGEQPRGLARQLVSTCRHATVYTLTIGR